MPWNEPGNNNDKDPWGNRKKPDGPPDIDEMLKKVMGAFGGKKGSGQSSTGGKNFFWIGAIFLVGVWGLSGLYTINELEEGIILRLGKYHDTVKPGLGWYPVGIDSLTKVNVNQLKQVRVQGEMLSKDINVVEVEIGLQYRIINPKDYLFSLVTPESTLTQAAESALRQIVGNSNVDAILTTEKERIRAEVAQSLDQILEPYNTGIKIIELTLEKAKPPRQVNDAFEEVNRAAQDAKKVVQEAEAYRNKEIPLAKAEAEKMKQQAYAYEAQVVAKSRGEVARFNQLLPQYIAAPRVTRDRLYIEAVEDVLSNSTKVMIDVDGGNNMMYLPLDQLMKNRNQEQR
jgi:membrane protease subunit HflK